MAEWEVFGESFFNVVQFAVWGVLIGGVYALVALGIVIINKSSGVFNFAHGYMMLIGGLFFWQFFTNEPSTALVFGTSGIATLVLLGVIASLGVTLSFNRQKEKAGNPLRLPNWFQAVLKRYKFHLVTLISLSIWLLIGYVLKENDPADLLVYGIGAVVTVLLVLAAQWLTDTSSDGSTTLDTDRTQDIRQIYAAIIASIVLWLILGWALLQPGNDHILRGAAGGFVASILIGLLIERFAIRPLLGQPVLTAILMTLAVGFMLQGMVQMIWGPLDRPVPIFVEKEKVSVTPIQTGFDETGAPVYIYIENVTPARTLEDYTIDTVDLLGEKLRLRRNLTWGFGVAISAFVAFVILFRFTSIGLALRAASENQPLAESVGLRVRLILAIAWAAVAIIATIAGVIQGTGSGGLSKDIIPALALRVFPAVLLGGLDSITGALVGGLLIGVIESLSALFISTTAAQEMMPFLVLMIVLMIRPDGLFGQRRIERV